LVYRKKKEGWLKRIETEIGIPFVVRPSNQGSSIGVSILKTVDINKFEDSVDAAFFICKIEFDIWKHLNEEQQIDYIREIAEVKDGIGLPFRCGDEIIYHPEKLLEFIQHRFIKSDSTLEFESVDKENEVLVEGFIAGKEFSCIVIQDENGKAVALPPTQIVKGGEVFDYRSKYLAGLSRKITPIELPTEQIQNIRKQCEELFRFFGFHVYARIDGFIQEDGSIFFE